MSDRPSVVVNVTPPPHVVVSPAGVPGPQGLRGLNAPNTGGAGSPVVPSVVWRPGRPSDEFCYETFDEIEALMAQDPQMRVLVDNTYGVCRILRDLECDSRTIWESAHPGTDAVAFLNFASGAKLLNPYRFSAVGLVKDQTGGAIVKMVKGGRLVFDDACVLYSTPGVDEPCVSISCAAAQLLFLRGSNAFQQEPDPTRGIVAIDHVGASTVLFDYQNGIGNTVSTTTLEGRAGDYAYVFTDSSWLWTPQLYFAGSTEVIPTCHEEHLQPSGGPSAGRPQNPRKWQMYGDDDLGIRIVWNGSAWTNLIGVPV